MTKQKPPWSQRKQKSPPVSWNGEQRAFTIVLDGFNRTKDTDRVEIEWSPPITYIVRIREVGSESWSFGFETPLTGCSFVDLEPDTDYELEIRSKNAHRESSPVTALVRTSPQGVLHAG